MFLPEQRDIYDVFRPMPGAIAVTEAIGIYNFVKQFYKATEGIAADLGSHGGKSSMFAALALYEMGYKENFNMVDLLYDGDNPAWADSHYGNFESAYGAAGQWAQGGLINPDFPENWRKRVGLFCGDRVKISGRSSLQFISEHDLFCYIFIDTDDHDPELVMSEAKALENKVSPGGIALFHDYKNQFTGVLKAVEYLGSTGKYEIIEMDWAPIKKYVKENDLEAKNNSWQAFKGDSYPTFVGGVRRNA